MRLKRPELVYEPCVPDSLGLDGFASESPQRIVVERNGYRAEVGLDTFREWWPDDKPIWLFSTNSYYTLVGLGDDLIRCAVSLEVGLANPYYREEVVVLKETIASRKIIDPRHELSHFDAGEWVPATLGLAAMLMGCERLLRHLLGHYKETDCFGDHLMMIDSGPLCRLVLSSTNWERRVVGHPGKAASTGATQVPNCYG